MNLRFSKHFLFLFVFFFMSVNTLYSQSAKRVRVKVLQEYPHNVKSYTQGLFFHNGIMYESTGQYGESKFLIVNYKSGKIFRQWIFPNKYFIEGSCYLNGRLYILTWQENKCFVYKLPPHKKVTDNDLERIGEINYRGEGWGITTDGKQLIMSDGSSYLSFLDPDSFYCFNKIQVTLDGKPIDYLNELEFINGKIWANVYGSDAIVIINPDSGVIEVLIDCRDLLPESLKTAKTDVLNGIAYNPEDNGVYVTGKYWPLLYKISY